MTTKGQGYLIKTSLIHYDSVMVPAVGIHAPAGTCSSLKKKKGRGRAAKIKEHLNHVMRKPVLAICQQQRCRSACASAQSDQHLCCSLLS